MLSVSSRSASGGKGAREGLTLLIALVPGANDDLALCALVCVECDDLVTVNVLVEKVEGAFEELVSVFVAALTAGWVLWGHSVGAVEDLVDLD